MFSSPGDLPDPGTEPVSCIAGRFFTSEPPGKPLSSGVPAINMWHCETRIIWGEFNKDNILKHKKEDLEPMEDMTVPYGQNRVKRGEGLLKMDKVEFWEPFYGSW